jgi:hypothetical protein
MECGPENGIYKYRNICVKGTKEIKHKLKLNKK